MKQALNAKSNISGSQESFEASEPVLKEMAALASIRRVDRSTVPLSWADVSGAYNPFSRECVQRCSVVKNVPIHSSFVAV